MRKFIFVAFASAALFLSGCDFGDTVTESETEAVQEQQAQYSVGQPVPAYNWSLERDLLIQLYNIRNERVATHSVWRSAHGMIEGDCPSMGFGMPYDTSLTNPLMTTSRSVDRRMYSDSMGVIEQPEPNGIFASKNTAATWVFCVGEAGALDPHYVETRVTVYPYSVDVDYATDRVVRAGESTVTIRPTE